MANPSQSTQSLISNVHVYGQGQHANGKTFTASGEINGRKVTINVKAGEGFSEDDLSKALRNSFVGKIIQVNKQETLVELENKFYKNLKITVSAKDPESRKEFQELKDNNQSLDRTTRMTSSSKRAFDSIKNGFKEIVSSAKTTVNDVMTKKPSLRLYDPKEHLEVFKDYLLSSKKNDVNVVYDPKDKSISFSKKKLSESQKEATVEYMLGILGQKIQEDRREYEKNNNQDSVITLKRDNLMLGAVMGNRLDYASAFANNEALNDLMADLIKQTII